jgi:biotin operon repressor
MTPATLASQLRVGTPRPISDIAEDCGVSRRKVEKAAEALAVAGYPIIATGRGIAVASSAEQLRKYEDELRGRIRSQLRRIRGVQRARRQYEMPLTLWSDAA